jgi:hypothetical protein
VCDFRSGYNKSQMLLMIWRLRFIDSVKMFYTNSVYKWNPYEYNGCLFVCYSSYAILLLKSITLTGLCLLVIISYPQLLVIISWISKPLALE